jgi:transcriptional regulator with XRE-family HTH domain
MESEPLGQRLGRRLRDARFRIGLTVREASELAGIRNHTQLVRYENGTAQPPLERLAALARTYQTTPAALFASQDEAVEVIATIDQADEAFLEQLLRALDGAGQ